MGRVKKDRLYTRKLVKTDTAYWDDEQHYKQVIDRIDREEYINRCLKFNEGLTYVHWTREEIEHDLNLMEHGTYVRHMAKDEEGRALVLVKSNNKYNVAKAITKMKREDREKEEYRRREMDEWGYDPYQYCDRY